MMHKHKNPISIANAFLILITAILIMTVSISNVSAQTKNVYLTFDDGPSKFYTPQILNILYREHVKATFFVLGYRSEEFPTTIRRMHVEGHEIGNHGYYHQYIVNKSKSWLESDVSKADAAIRAACGVKPIYFRPPGGIINPEDLEIVQKMGHPIALWTVDTE